MPGSSHGRRGRSGGPSPPPAASAMSSRPRGRAGRTTSRRECARCWSRWRSTGLLWSRRRAGCVVAHSREPSRPIRLFPAPNGTMRRMPGTNLTRDEARTRAGLLEVESYTVDLDLDPSRTTTFGSTTVIRFRSRTVGASTFADLVGGTVHELTLNGRSLDPAEVYADHRIRLDGLETDNELRVVADCTYSHTGEGLHRFVDPADDRVYLYSQMEVPDARRVFTTFEQPDLKSVFTFTVTAPEHWVVVSVAPTPEPEPAEDDRAVWRFPATERLSTYVTAIVAGEYHEVRDTYVGKHGEIPLGHYCRQSIAEHLDSDVLVDITKKGFAFFEEAFDYP